MINIKFCCLNKIQNFIPSILIFKKPVSELEFFIFFITELDVHRLKSLSEILNWCMNQHCFGILFSLS